MAENSHKVVFYGLSTCIHCRHAREFLEENDVPFELHYVDLAEGEDRTRLLEKVREYNPSISFPTIVIDDNSVVVGFTPDALKGKLGL
jgi:glutaredoxin